MLSVFVDENLRAVTPFDPVDVAESAVPFVRRVSELLPPTTCQQGCSSVDLSSCSLQADRPDAKPPSVLPHSTVASDISIQTIADREEVLEKRTKTKTKRKKGRERR